jgi:hypothetical protein
MRDLQLRSYQLIVDADGRNLLVNVKRGLHQFQHLYVRLMAR